MLSGVFGRMLLHRLVWLLQLTLWVAAHDWSGMHCIVGVMQRYSCQSGKSPWFMTILLAPLFLSASVYSHHDHWYLPSEFHHASARCSAGNSDACLPGHVHAGIGQDPYEFNRLPLIFTDLKDLGDPQLQDTRMPHQCSQ